MNSGAVAGVSSGRAAGVRGQLSVRCGGSPASLLSPLVKTIYTPYTVIHTIQHVEYCQLATSN